MKKMVLSFLFCFILCLSVFADLPSDFFGENCTYTVEDEVLTISGEGEVKIKTEYLDYYHSKEIPYVTEIYVEEGITSIDLNYFPGYSITKIKLPSSLKLIDYAAFEGFDRLTRIVIPEGVEIIREGAFLCESLRFVTLPKSIKEIHKNAFSSVERVYYAGSESDWEAIEVLRGNADLLDAEIVFNYSESEASTEKNSNTVSEINNSNYVCSHNQFLMYGFFILSVALLLCLICIIILISKIRK